MNSFKLIRELHLAEVPTGRDQNPRVTTTNHWFQPNDYLEQRNQILNAANVFNNPRVIITEITGVTPEFDRQGMFGYSLENGRVWLVDVGGKYVAVAERFEFVCKTLTSATVEEFAKHLEAMIGKGAEILSSSFCPAPVNKWSAVLKIKRDPDHS